MTSDWPAARNDPDAARNRREPRYRFIEYSEMLSPMGKTKKVRRPITQGESRETNETRLFLRVRCPSPSSLLRRPIIELPGQREREGRTEKGGESRPRGGQRRRRTGSANSVACLITALHERYTLAAHENTHLHARGVLYAHECIGRLSDTRVRPSR